MDGGISEWHKRRKIQFPRDCGGIFRGGLYEVGRLRDGDGAANPFPMFRNMCIPISMYNIDSIITIERIERDGPMTYSTASILLGVDLAPSTLAGAGPSDGRYLLRHTDHCVGIYIKGGDVTISDSRTARSDIYDKISFFRSFEL